MHALCGLPVPLRPTRAILREARPGLERGVRARPRLRPSLYLFSSFTHLGRLVLPR